MSEIERELKDYVRKIKDACKLVEDETKKLQEMVIHQNSEITEKEILHAAKATALTTSKLTDLIEVGVPGVQLSNNENVNLQEELLISTSKDVRNNVLKFLKCAKEVFDNPYDYLTSQNLNGALQEVTNSITNTITTANMLRIIVQKEMGESINKVDVMKEEAKDKIIEAAKELAGTVRQLVEILKSKLTNNQNQPIELMKKLVVNLKHLISVSVKSNFDLDTLCESLKIATHQLLGLSKTYLFEKNSRNQISLSKIENAAANLASEIRSILMQAQKNAISNQQSRESPKISDDNQTSKSENSDERNSISERKTDPNTIESTSQESIEENNKSKITTISSPTKRIHISQKDREKLKKTSQDIINILIKHLKGLSTEWNNKNEKEKSTIIEETTTKIEEAIRNIHESQARTKSMVLVGRASEQDNVAKQNLNSLFNADSLDDWQEMLTGTKGLFMTGIGGSATVKISIDSGGSSSLQELYNELYNRTLQFIIHANHAVLSEKTTEESVSDKVKQLYETCIRVLSVIVENNSISSNSNVSSLVYSYIETIRSAEISSPPNEYIVLDAQGQLAQLVYSGLLKQLYTASDSVRVIFLHLLTTLKQIVEDENTPISEMSALQIVASTKTAMEVVEQLLTVVSTARKISYQRANQSEQKVDKEEEEFEDVEFWEEHLKNNSDSTPRTEVTQEKSSFPGIKMYVEKKPTGPSKKPLPKKGTLNQLVEAITSVDTYDSKYMKTFITTYRSFTSPSRLLEKLIQRYNAPSRVSKEDGVNIQLRVGVVIKYWVENQFIDFDDNLVEKLNDFINNTLKKAQSELSELLHKQVAKLDEARKNKITIFQKPPTNLTTPPGQYNPSELFFQMSSDEIARQITMIDWSIFSAIEPAELLNQSWNKISLQHRAQNVFALVSRLNKVSYWIPAMILWQLNMEARCAMLTKFMEIGIYLYKLNNYNGLMGVIAGLNMSSVSRLKKTWGIIQEQNLNNPNSILSQYRKLETLMSPTGSWKNYRSSLSSAKLPAIPYLGTYLGDLTFIDEGNPNNINKQINFEKRELIYNIIYDVKRFQAQSFKFPIVEPIHTLLAELPSFSDKDMYAVSLCREPRENTTLSNSGSSSNLNKGNK